MSCSVEGCDRKVRSQGMCGAHYQRWVKGLDLTKPLKVIVRHDPNETCAVDGCERKVEKTNYCGMHYQRLKANGDPTKVRPRGFPKEDTEEKLRRYLSIKGESDCWEWFGTTDHRGYGRMAAREINEQQPHRVAYRLWVGELQPGECVLHKCDNPKCCNPKHLFIGDNNTNTQDMITKGRDRSFGRPRSLSPEDVLFVRDKNNSIKSICAKFGISPAMVTLIRARKSYAHIL